MVKFPLVLTLISPFVNFSSFGPKSEGMSFLLGRTVPHECIFGLSKSSKSLGDEKKLSINSLCPKPSGGPQVGDPPPLVAAWGSSSCVEASCSSSNSENLSSKLLASAPDSESVSPTRIHLWLAHPALFSLPPSQNVPHSDSLGLFCTTGAIARQTECLEHSVSL